MEPRPMYVLLGVLAFTFPAYCRDYHDVIWNSRFFPQHLKHSPMNVRLGDQLTIICPKSFHRGMHYEYAKLYWVGKQDFDQCTHNTYYTKLMGVCANETETTAIKMIFQKYNPIPNGIDFQIGEIYYIVSTSSGHLEDISQPTGGLCWQENMKLAIRIVGEELPRMKYEVHDYQSLVSSSTSSPLSSTMNSLVILFIASKF
ncbi:Protein CBR-EFN-3 [Caenorhabditis briggsae]|uniref:Ephrin-4 n=1 Tax=Caenorhabditis briggsae TaxID=6238 RepID=A8X4R5_CAEBR|nr:Protein CBR-EFN-3 [Caenorhabditis briggsae]CAP27625.2 Protein CBR-EFN-3 [Caenorhabditis briggsae]